MGDGGYLGHEHERPIMAGANNALVHCLKHGIRGLLDLLDALLGCGICKPKPQGFLEILKACPDLQDVLLTACHTSHIVRPANDKLRRCLQNRCLVFFQARVNGTPQDV